MAMTFAQLLRDYRLKRSLTQQVLADKVGVKRAYIALLETGQRRNPSRQTLRAVVKALGLSDPESQRLFMSLGYPTSAGQTKVASTSPVVEALTELVDLPPESPQVREKIVELYKRLSAVLAERGVTKQQKKETRWLQLVTKGYMYSPPEGGRGRQRRTGEKQKLRLPRSQEDELRMGDRLRSLLEIFVDGRIHISKRAALAEELLKFARWQIEEETESMHPRWPRVRRKKTSNDSD